MKLEVGSDAKTVPFMIMTAETLDEKRQLAEVLEGLVAAQRQAVAQGRAGRFNTCGSETDNEGVIRLTLQLALGGNVELNYVPDPADER